MRNKTILLLCSALLSGSLSLSLLGCGGCASTQPRSGAASPSFQGIEILPEEKELSPAAKDTYAYLLYMQALADEDEELLLQAAQQMTGGTLPAKAWLEGALWLDSRRSEKGLPLLELRPRTASLEEVFLDLTDDNDTVAARAAALFQTSVETAEKEAVGDESDL